MVFMVGHSSSRPAIQLTSIILRARTHGLDNISCAFSCHNDPLRHTCLQRSKPPERAALSTDSEAAPTERKSGEVISRRSQRSRRQPEKIGLNRFLSMATRGVYSEDYGNAAAPT